MVIIGEGPENAEPKRFDIKVTRNKKSPAEIDALATEVAFGKITTALASISNPFSAENDMQQLNQLINDARGTTNKLNQYHPNDSALQDYFFSLIKRHTA